MSSHDPQVSENGQARQPSPRPAAPLTAPATTSGTAPATTSGCATPSVGDLLATCAAARAVSTPPSESTEHAAPESAAPRATPVRDAPPRRDAA
jgi:hypothetical protein